jgi:hypothetical protein
MTDNTQAREQAQAFDRFGWNGISTTPENVESGWYGWRASHVHTFLFNGEQYQTEPANGVAHVHSLNIPGLVAFTNLGNDGHHNHRIEPAEGMSE